MRKVDILRAVDRFLSAPRGSNEEIDAIDELVEIVDNERIEGEDR